MKQPPVSVCVATYNQEKYIGRCLESILKQDRALIREIFVGDDCSNDKTSNIVADFASRFPDTIFHVRHSPRRGPIGNIQDLLERVKGLYVAYVDGDDYWLPNKLRCQVDYLEGNPYCSAVYTNALAVNEKGDSIGVFNNVGDARFDLSSLLRRGNFLNSSSLLLRAQGVNAILGIDGPCIDYRIHLLMAQLGEIAHLGAPLTVYRVNAAGSMLANANDRVRELYWEAIMSVPDHLISGNDRALALADFLRRVSFRAVRTGRLELIARWAPRVFLESPYGQVRTTWLTLKSIARILAIMAKDKPVRKARVLYYR